MAKSFEMTRKDIKTVKKLWHLALKKYVKSVFIAFVFLMLSAGGEAYSLSLLEPIFDSGFIDKNNGALGLISLQIMGVFFLKSLALYAHTYIMGMTGLRATREIQIKVFQKFLGMDMGFFARKNFGTLQTHFGADSKSVDAFLKTFFTKFLKDIITIIFMLGYMIYISPRLSIIIFVLLPAIAYPLARFGKRYRAIFGRSMKKSEEFGSYFHQVLQSIPIVKIYGKEKQEIKRADSYLMQLLELSRKNLRISARSRPTMEVLGGMAISGVLLIGGSQIASGLLTTGELVTFLAMLFACYRPLKSLSNTFVEMQSSMKNAERLLELMDEKTAIFDVKGARVLKTKKANISFENISFRYDEKTSILENISFEVPSGKTVALVGASGGGKSTVMKLLPRFYDVQEGQIKINGTDIRHLTLKSLREHMAFVTQDTMLFEGTIAENIAYGASHNVSQKEIEQAAKYANAHEFILEFEKGYQQPVGEKGGSLSGGQKQRISIARALLKNAPILLLDEATSALDTQSEYVVQQALDKLMTNRTTLVIAHRLSTIIHADKIVVVDRGQIVEEGSHEVLLKKKGYYANLYQMQLKKKK
ncbi:MAG: ATP-binding cassette domain-containing protein [Alphaproteobacteria bacterium]|nr:ATP-binding cassette domain-containing protein [Alphaproteobacteria bacterium]